MTAGGPDQIQAVDLSALTASSDVVVGEKAQRESSGPAPDLQQLTATTVTTTTLQRGPVWCSGTPERTVRVFGTDDGLWLLDDNGGSAETNEPYRASAADIDELSGQFLDSEGMTERETALSGGTGARR